jgi:hypothetical protein
MNIRANREFVPEAPVGCFNQVPTEVFNRQKDNRHFRDYPPTRDAPDMPKSTLWC